ncbi:MAG: protein kinase [Gemmatimonadaceae bacterium]|nr:protein kinase [Gemmatimonadaceae bacterium]
MEHTAGDLQRALGDRYLVERELGAGGMATVFLARDVRHDRLVAIKVLRAELAAAVGGERFLSEIRTTANLQHPHVLSLHDSGESDGIVYYVMPFVDGESLRERLVRDRQLGVAEAVRIASEVASGLDYAHRRGIVHRDIKPENILLHDGRAVIADFGIALAVSRSGEASRMTATGMSLGTPQYMSPEQAMGDRDISPRSDVYALGCVLYEMLAGEPPFTAPTPQAIIARIMTEEPRSLTLQRRTVPPHVDRAVQTALAKLPADRFETAAQFAAALAAASISDGYTAAAPIAPHRRRAHPALLAVAALALVALGAAATFTTTRGRAADVASPAILSIMLPAGLVVAGSPIGTLALSADGRTLVYAAGSDSGTSMLMVRTLDDPRSRPIPGTEGAASPTISPDGQTIAFFTGTQLGAQFRQSSIAGTSPVTLPLAGTLGIPIWRAAGGFWANAPNGVLSVLEGGRFTPLPGLDSAAGSTVFNPVAELPDGRVLAIASAQAYMGQLWILDPDDGTRTRLVEQDVAGAGYASGHVAWVLATGVLHARALDLRRGTLTGPLHTLATDVRVPPGSPAHIAFASSGAIAYAPAAPSDLVLVDRTGRAETISGQPQRFHSPRVSPDGRRIAFDVSAATRDVWVLDRDDATLTRVTFDDGGHDPVWMPDGRELLYAAVRSSSVGVHRVRADGSGTRDSIVHLGVQFTANSVSPDGREVMGVRVGDATGTFDMVHVALGPTVATTPMLESPRFGEGFPMYSPDGRWIAYVSDESGRPEVYLRNRDGSTRATVSAGGGTEPVWSRSGGEIFYRDLDSRWLWSAAIAPGAAPRVTGRTRLFDISDFDEASPHANYDVTPDGRFVFVRQPRTSEIVYVQGWPGLVGARR